MALLSKAEQSYIQQALLADSPQRIDGRDLTDYRNIALETGVAPLANGSARVNIGRQRDGGGGTEVVAAIKLEVEDASDRDEDGVDEAEVEGRIIGAVSCSPAAYPHLSSNAVDDLQHDLTAVLHSVLAHPTLRPKNLTIVPGKKAWAVHLDVVVYSDAGNVCDAIFMAARAALWDTKVPKTRSVEYRALGRKGDREDDAMEVDDGVQKSGLDTRTKRSVSTKADFELTDYWDEGESLDGREAWPVCVTLNILPSVHFLDATLKEEISVPLRLHAMFSFSAGGKASLRSSRLIGMQTTDMKTMNSLLQEGQKYAQNIWNALESKLVAEDTRRNHEARERFQNR
ncbi:ribosomal protein S5 domain 2-like protein [Coniophora puteana RWD-64-598 SS2]|uniref:Ribosomal RNA-processing protein 42 n=1 Tax=Coniophora puteana (strain RWD-64-598) TaxID=741705 RepID=A0A5M3MFJ5_CONPW|nr:ribosomal protein S5 domain 2-like protein [Coniophora puteana RWD-64-598 SS2]EIW77766.1 ribosomal protein S5 domain 2-like protein [Coniophora puteana RWD-64-598 SS2]